MQKCWNHFFVVYDAMISNNPLLAMLHKTYRVSVLFIWTINSCNNGPNYQRLSNRVVRWFNDLYRNGKERKECWKSVFRYLGRTVKMQKMSCSSSSNNNNSSSSNILTEGRGGSWYKRVDKYRNYPKMFVTSSDFRSKQIVKV